MRWFIRSQGWIRDTRAILIRFIDSAASFGIRRSGGGVVIVKIDAIGDFILWVNSGRELRRIFPEQKLTLIANESWSELAKSLPYWDQVISVKVKRFTIDMPYRWSVVRNLRRLGFDTAVQPTISRHFLTGDPLVKATGARLKIGSVGDRSLMTVKEKRVADGWYTTLFPFTEQGLTELELHAEFTSHLGGGGFPASLPKLPRFEVMERDKPSRTPYFVVFPGASWVGRQWPADRFASMVSTISKESDALAVLCGGNDEVELCNAIAAQCGTDTVNLAGKTSLTEFAELVRQSIFLVGNETSCIHIAAAVGTPSICILGGGHFRRFLPYPKFSENYTPKVVFQQMSCFGCNWVCTQPHDANGAMPCMNAISVEAVLSEVRCLLSASADKQLH